MFTHNFAVTFVCRLRYLMAKHTSCSKRYLPLSVRLTVEASGQTGRCSSLGERRASWKSSTSRARVCCELSGTVKGRLWQNIGVWVRYTWWMSLSCSPVHVARFMNDNLRVFSGGDDNVVRLFDIPSETEIQTFREHEVSCFYLPNSVRSYSHQSRLMKMSLSMVEDDNKIVLTQLKCNDLTQCFCLLYAIIFLGVHTWRSSSSKQWKLVDNR